MKTKAGLELPPDLEQELLATPVPLAAWGRLRPSCQRAHLRAVLDAKQPETRRRRIAAVVKATLEWHRRHPPRTRAGE